MPYLWQLPVLLAAVLLLLVQAAVINRLAGIPYPLWRAVRPGLLRRRRGGRAR